MTTHHAPHRSVRRGPDRVSRDADGTVPPPPMWTAQQVAEYLTVSVSTVHRLDADGELPCKRIGRAKRWHRPTVEAWAATPDPVPTTKRTKVDDLPTWLR